MFWFLWREPKQLKNFSDFCIRSPKNLLDSAGQLEYRSKNLNQRIIQLKYVGTKKKKQSYL